MARGMNHDRIACGRLALLTGAGSGIGAGIALAMGAAGARVIAADLNEETAAATANRIGGDAAYFALDVTQRAAVSALATLIARELGPISVLVNNAGIVRRGKVEDATARADWDATLAVNLTAPFIVTTAFLDQARGNEGQRHLYRLRSKWSSRFRTRPPTRRARAACAY